MSEVKWKYHPSNPAAQPFNLNGKKCRAKERSWWNTASPTHWRNKDKKANTNAQ